MPYYPETDTDGLELVRTDAFPNSDRYSFSGISLEPKPAIATKNSTTDLYFAITKTFAFNGVQIFLDHHVKGDWVSLIIESDGTVANFGPAGTTLNVFAKKWVMDWTNSAQGVLTLPYRGTLTQGMRINLRYHSVGATNDVDVYCNFFLHTEQGS